MKRVIARACSYLPNIRRKRRTLRRVAALLSPEERRRLYAELPLFLPNIRRKGRNSAPLSCRFSVKKGGDFAQSSVGLSPQEKEETRRAVPVFPVKTEEKTRRAVSVFPTEKRRRRAEQCRSFL